jgi:acyl-coenzyme A thioesterase PaaI-like protein
MNKLRSDANRCFVCGPTNPIGLRLQFHLEDDICRSEFTPARDHCGYDSVTHGGIVFSVLDDVMANWLFLKGLRAYTAKCDIRYRDMLPIGTTVRLEGECIRQRGRLTVMRGTMTRKDNHQVVAECEASFMLADDLD